MFATTGNLRRDYDRLSEKYEQQKDRILGYQEENKSLKLSLKRAQNTNEKLKRDYENILAEKDAIINELNIKLAKATAIANHDGTNTGTPTSQTPINKEKVIPNSRRSTGKTKGGQKGHIKHSMESFSDDEVTENVDHELDVEAEHCDKCGGSLLATEDSVDKDEFDVQIKVVKRRHRYKIYKCINCGKTWRAQINPEHKEKNQYGRNIQAIALSLMVTGNVAINKVRMLLNGFTEGAMLLSEGFICKLYRRASKALDNFIKELKIRMIQLPLLYWDDTVIMINKDRACMRFYGNDNISYYAAHLHKDMESLMDDNILPLLTSETTVMHDHNKVNYNEKFCFKNIECNQHLQRDLQKVTDDYPGHIWSSKLKELISVTIKERKDAIAEGMTEFSADYIESFLKKLDDYVKEGWRESEKVIPLLDKTFEKTLLKRIEEYKDNYFLWVKDFSMPTTDNLSERGLRGIKSHTKISGQFENEGTSIDYGKVKTYVETCRKNGFNEMEALARLCNGKPYTVAEILG